MKDNPKEGLEGFRDNLDLANDSGNVKVMCRFRPINRSEQEKTGSNIIWEFEPNGKSVTITTSKNVGSGLVGTNKFTFDRVFDMNTSQRDVYDQSARSIIEGVLKGFNGTVFAYGQTGSGKTHTMQGTDIENIELQGIVPRMVRTVFNKINNMSENIEFTVKVSMCEIYMEKIRDLLDPAKIDLKVKENKDKGVYIKDLTERYIASDAEVYDIMKIGNEHRKTSCTAMNDVSSRSHSIFMMTISQNNLDDFSSK